MSHFVDGCKVRLTKNQFWIAGIDPDVDWGVEDNVDILKGTTGILKRWGRYWCFIPDDPDLHKRKDLHFGVIYPGRIFELIEEKE